MDAVSRWVQRTFEFSLNLAFVNFLFPAARLGQLKPSIAYILLHVSVLHPCIMESFFSVFLKM